MKPQNTSDRPKRASRDRLSKEVWLGEALEVLSREGEGKLRIDGICRSLKVTKGSFYWHFEGRNDFIQSLLDFWRERFNVSVPETTEEHGGSAMDRLRFLFEFVTSNQLGRYDVAIDAWAAHEPGVAQQVREVYQMRFDYVGSLFRELGFRGIDLETRTTALLAFLKSESSVSGRKVEKRTARRLELELKFFTSPLPQGG